MSASARMISYAQNLEDVLLWRALAHRLAEPDATGSVGGPGFYIDVGASDPTLLSVTRAFYDAGWHGLNIEPLPEAAARLRAARPRDTTIEVALAAKAGPPVPFHRVTMAEQTGLSTLSPEQAAQHAAAGAVIDTLHVPVTTLAEICRAHVHGPVHFLKIDAEGAEPDILAGADLSLLRPWIVLVEATPPGDHASDQPPAWEPDLLAAGYSHVWSDGLNRFYLAQEHAGLARHFRLPPNIFDNYVVHDHLQTRRLEEEIALSELRRGYIVQLEAHIAMLTPVVPPAAVAPGPPPPMPAVPASAAPDQGGAPMTPHTTRRSVARRLAGPLYTLVRPVARPLAARLRRYLIGPLQQELDARTHQLALQLDTLLARQPAILATDPAIPMAHPAIPMADPALLAAMERFMLTLALQDTSDPSPPMLAPAPAETFQSPEPLANVPAQRCGDSPT